MWPMLLLVIGKEVQCYALFTVNVGPSLYGCCFVVDMWGILRSHASCDRAWVGTLSGWLDIYD
jgi:hypothetical protein